MRVRPLLLPSLSLSFVSYFLGGSKLCHPALCSQILPSFSLGPCVTPPCLPCSLVHWVQRTPPPISGCHLLILPLARSPLTRSPSSRPHSPVTFCSFLRLLLTILTAPSLLLPSSLRAPWPPVVSSLAPVPAAFPTPCPLPGLGGPLGPLCLLGPSPMESGKTNLSVTSLPSHCDLFSPTWPGIFS